MAINFCKHSTLSVYDPYWLFSSKRFRMVLNCIRLLLQLPCKDITMESVFPHILWHSHTYKHQSHPWLFTRQRISVKRTIGRRIWRSRSWWSHLYSISSSRLVEICPGVTDILCSRQQCKSLLAIKGIEQVWPFSQIAINYSSGLSLQLLGHYFHAVPRFIWSLLFIIVVGALAIAGSQTLSTVVSNFVSLLGYWTVSFTLVLLMEDRWFRRIDGYNLYAWDNPKKLPPGIAAITALLAGYLAGGVPGMSQTWYIGPIAEKFGSYGGDVGVYMSAVITLIWYPIARTIEKRMTGR